jgi:Fe-S-cluster-containing dehydrogenase component/DMSO reductase anchor subunit
LETTEAAQLLLPAPRAADRREPVRLPLLQAYLDEQQRLSAVERFALRHDAGEGPAQARYYDELIPSGKPGSGQQYGFSVDLDRCTGCKACVTACRSLNGLDAGETWRAVGVLHGGTAAAPYQQSVTAACHHCVDPGCMKGCPVGAYEKDPITGIVRHLDDQCIGCQYCTLTCPYEVPQYNERLGIVRKCDMCADRLAVGEAPACVQACPSEAISIRIVERADIVAASETGRYLPAAPPPAITLPSTEYRTRRPFPANVVPVDFERVRPAAQHAPLAVTLILTQLSVGAFAVDLWLGRAFPAEFDGLRPYHSLLSLAVGLLALGASLVHLGRPQFAFRAVLGIRTSWLSREIVAFGAFAGLAALYSGALFHAPISRALGVPDFTPGTASVVENVLALAVAALGSVGVLCSAMLYRATGRTYWRGPTTTVRFFLSAAVLGVATTLLVSVAGGAPEVAGAVSLTRTLAGHLALMTVVKLAHEAAILTHLNDRQQVDLRRTATLLISELRDWTGVRVAAGVLGGILLPLLIHYEGGAGGTSNASVVFAVTAWALVLLGELAERALFFMGVSAAKMPGSVGT